MEPYVNGSDKLEDYGCYGVPVVAPANGLIVKARDGEPDEVPGMVSNNFTAPEGNFVAIQLDETGTYLIIAHLKAGSVTVKTGDTVVEGQVIGACGNSGNTSEPHIPHPPPTAGSQPFSAQLCRGASAVFQGSRWSADAVGGFEMDDQKVILTEMLCNTSGK
ncbi:MAG: M23 family metallopeptidase [Desulfobacterales bacterium]|nr:M23 family metallopeptidase [Desulfobacterales bacterium]